MHACIYVCTYVCMCLFVWNDMYVDVCMYVLAQVSKPLAIYITGDCRTLPCCGNPAYWAAGSSASDWTSISSTKTNTNLFVNRICVSCVYIPYLHVCMYACYCEVNLTPTIVSCLYIYVCTCMYVCIVCKSKMNVFVWYEQLSTAFSLPFVI